MPKWAKCDKCGSATREGEKFESYLIRVLAALLKERGGELRIKKNLLETGERIGYQSDYDAEKNEVIFRLSSKESELVLTNYGEQQGQWVDPAKKITTTSSTEQETPARKSSNLLEENQRLVELDNQMRRRSIARQVLDAQRNLNLNQS